MEVRNAIVKRYLSKGRRYVYHAATGANLPDLPLDHPDMQEAIRIAERNAETASSSADLWGGVVPVGLSETIAPMAPPSSPHVIAFSVPQIIRFVFRAAPGDVIYYHHGNLLEDARREQSVRQKGRYVALCCEFGLLGPRQKRGFGSDWHYYAVRTGQRLTGLPRYVLDGSITPDEYQSLVALSERQASMSTSRVIRDTLGISDTQASEIRNEFIQRGWLSNGRPPELTDKGLQLLG